MSAWRSSGSVLSLASARGLSVVFIVVMRDSGYWILDAGFGLAPTDVGGYGFLVPSTDFVFCVADPSPSDFDAARIWPRSWPWRWATNQAPTARATPLRIRSSLP